MGAAVHVVGIDHIVLNVADADGALPFDTVNDTLLLPVCAKLSTPVTVNVCIPFVTVALFH